MSLLGRSLRDLWAHRFLSAVTTFAVAMSVLIVGAFSLFVVNAAGIIQDWGSGARIVAYLSPGVESDKVPLLRGEIGRIEGVAEVRYISRDAAMERLRKGMAEEAFLLDHLRENPLPDALEVSLFRPMKNWRRFAPAAQAIREIDGVAEVEFGEEWLGRFLHLMDLFRLSAAGMGGIFFLAAVFFMANTVRLLLYARREEIEILYLVGATHSFIRLPLYLQGMLHGIIGAGAGLGALYGAFYLISIRAPGVGTFPIRFLSEEIMGGILTGSVLVGWFGTYLSLKRFHR